MKGRLDGKTAVVTGASRGIGHAICRLFVREGARVVGVARSQETLKRMEEQLTSETGGSFTGRKADVTSRNDARSVIEETLALFGQLDILVNNAGAGHYAPIAELSESAWDEMQAVNLKGPFLWTQAVLPHMMKRKEGDLILIASVAGVTTFPGGGGYCASKWGLNALADTLRQEVKPYELRVTSIGPGSVQTSFAGTPPKDYALHPEDVAQVALDVASAPRRVIYNTVVMRPLVPSDRA